MRVRHVQCPVCGTILNVPPGCANCNVRCGTCRHRFRLPRHIAVTDDAIAEWLWQGQRRPEDRQALTEPQKAQQIRQARQRAAKARQAKQAIAAGETAILPALTDELRLVRVDNRGAMFEYPADRLNTPEFRCAMPRKCLRCGAKTHLQAHLIIYTTRLQDSFTVEAQHGGRRLVLNSRDAQSLAGPRLLGALPAVPGVPAPGNLPMPYWLCDMCTGTGMIAAQIQINPDTGKGACRLLIRNLRRAEEFFLAAGGEGSADYAEFRRYIASVPEKPWDNLSETVQQRLGQWYRPGKGEQLLAYVADRSRPRDDDGLYGIIVSTGRLILRTSAESRQAKPSDRLRLELSSATGRPRLRVKAPTWEVKRFCMDRESPEQLRRALSAGKFNAVWY